MEFDLSSDLLLPQDWLITEKLRMDLHLGKRNGEFMAFPWLPVHPLGKDQGVSFIKAPRPSARSLTLPPSKTI